MGSKGKDKKMKWNVVMGGGVVVAWCLAAPVAYSQDAPANAAPADPQAIADTIGREVAQIRGLAFKQPVGVETQSSERFGEYVAGKIDETVPQSIRSHYGKIVQTLGLYRGPPIEDFSSMMTAVMASQVGAYYDPQKQRFYIVMTRMPELMQGVLYSHELYHALQDQYFGLTDYLKFERNDPSFSSDRLLARQSVVEGEATYMMTLWLMQRTTRSLPPREALARVVTLQSNISLDQLRTMLQQPQVAQLMGEDIRDAMSSADKIPPFILDTMLGAYLKGLGFVFAVQEQGWSAVEKLYTEYPPQSTEQILHPQKWVAREGAATIAWPNFARAAALRDWELLDNDVLGEFRWRTVFKEHGLPPADAEAAAAGWGGDRYAVFKRKDSDATLLLMRTSWDTVADATEFVAAYRRVLAVKYADAPKPTRLVQKGVDVFIVEGGEEGKIDSLLSLVRKAKTKRS
jgi:hypothetical protein